MSLLYYKQQLLSTSVDGRKSSSLQKFCRILSTAAQITIHRVKSDRKTAKKFLCKKTQKSSESLRILLSATLGDCPSRCVAHLAIARCGVCMPGDCPLRCLPLCLAIARRGVSLHLAIARRGVSHAWRLPVAVFRSPGDCPSRRLHAWRLPVAASACLAIARRGVSLAWRLPVAESASMPGDCPLRCVVRLTIACRFFCFSDTTAEKIARSRKKTASGNADL